MGITSESADNFALSHVTLMTPNRQRTLFRDLTIDPGKRVNLLVVGQSGVGKSSLLRAIAGLWNQGQGIVKRPPPQVHAATTHADRRVLETSRVADMMSSTYVTLNKSVIGHPTPINGLCERAPLTY
jgi:putative ATP-binding cassette transporter